MAAAVIEKRVVFSQEPALEQPFHGPGKIVTLDGRAVPRDDLLWLTYPWLVECRSFPALVARRGGIGDVCVGTSGGGDGGNAGSGVDAVAAPMRGADTRRYPS